MVDIHSARIKTSGEGEEGVAAATTAATESEKTARFLIGAACFLFVVAALVVVFAPPEKQGLAYAMGIALVVVAFGAIGATQFEFKFMGASAKGRSGPGSSAIESRKKSDGVKKGQSRARKVVPK